MTGEPSSQNPGAAAPTVDIIIQEKAWLERLPGLEGLVKELAAKTLAKTVTGGFPDSSSGPALEVSFCFAGDEFIRDLNAEFRGQDKPTNVLSFPAGFDVKGKIPALHLGDVILAFGVVEEEAGEQEKALADHTAHLVIHGLLHLLGFNHETGKEAAEMEALEIDLLKTFGIANPYE